MSRVNGLTNSVIAELLAREADVAKSPMAEKALRRASRRALSWQVEVEELQRESLPFTQLDGIGPYLEKIIKSWFESPPRVGAKDPTRADFLTWTEAGEILSGNPGWSRRYKGDLQMHTVWSDGSGTVREMAEAAIARGYSYIAITDHSKGLKIARGIDEERLSRQAEEIDQLNAEFRKSKTDFRVWKAIELNITPQGEGDMDEAALRGLDFVVGSFHSALRKKEDQTARYLAALENPNVHILGHPRGRIYNYRNGLIADWKRVFEKAASFGKAVEIDSFPDRQDLNVELLLLAKKAGCLIAIDTDAHHAWQLEFVRYGLAAALKAGLDPKKIVNFRNGSDLHSLFHGNDK